MDYLAIFEPNEDGSYCVYVPDLPGCTSAGHDFEDAQQMVREAIEVHIESLREHNELVPPPTSQACVIHVAENVRAA